MKFQFQCETEGTVTQCGKCHSMWKIYIENFVNEQDKYFIKNK